MGSLSSSQGVHYIFSVIFVMMPREVFFKLQLIFFLHATKQRRDDKCVENFSGKNLDKRDHLIRMRHMLEDNINIDFKGTSMSRSEPDMTTSVNRIEQHRK